MIKNQIIYLKLFKVKLLKIKLDLFDNYTNLEFNKINILKQGGSRPLVREWRKKEIKTLKNTVFTEIFKLLQMTIKKTEKGENLRC